MEILDQIVQIINQVGFPIACVIAMFWLWKHESDAHKDEASKFADSISKFSEVLGKNTEAINNNTNVMARLLDHWSER